LLEPLLAIVSLKIDRRKGVSREEIEGSARAEEVMCVGLTILYNTLSL
jgi:hypothetical protein